jgi:hypothetical protein
MKIIRERLEIVKTAGKDKTNKADKSFFLNVRKVLKGLSGAPVSLRPHSEPGGHVHPDQVKAIFYTGSPGPDADTWTDELEKLVQISAVKSLLAKVIHYTIKLSPGERFTDENARLSLETLLEIMGFGTAADYLTMSFWHAETESQPEHLHLVACRISLRDNSILTEHGRFYPFGLMKARAKIESVCGFSSSPRAIILYRGGMYLNREAAEFEERTGEPSEERRMLGAVEAIAAEVRSGGVTTWKEFLERCAGADMNYILGKRGGSVLQSPSGHELYPSFWFPELARGKLESRFQQPYGEGLAQLSGSGSGI